MVPRLQRQEPEPMSYADATAFAASLATTLRIASGGAEASPRLWKGRVGPGSGRAWRKERRAPPGHIIPLSWRIIQ
ncbi:hypothetical protein GTK01_19625 [Aliihoeflea sp. 40Bstr573]|nr:hypothetical protein [Aliihoeflea sp. 40Bstr573]